MGYTGCRLCLQSIADHNFILLEEAHKNMLQILFPVINWNAVIHGQPKMCLKCSENLKITHQFKISCLNNNRKAEILEELDETLEMTRRVCCLCCEGTVFIDLATPVKINLKEMVHRCFPQLKLTFSDSLESCEECLNRLRNLNLFINSLVENENYITNYCSTTGISRKDFSLDRLKNFSTAYDDNGNGFEGAMFSSASEETLATAAVNNCNSEPNGINVPQEKADTQQNINDPEEITIGPGTAVVQHVTNDPDNITRPGNADADVLSNFEENIVVPENAIAQQDMDGLEENMEPGNAEAQQDMNDLEENIEPGNAEAQQDTNDLEDNIGPGEVTENCFNHKNKNSRLSGNMEMLQDINNFGENFIQPEVQQDMNEENIIEPGNTEAQQVTDDPEENIIEPVSAGPQQNTNGPQENSRDDIDSGQKNKLKNRKSQLGKFNCDQCDYVGKHKTNLVSHMMRHKDSSSTKMHKCEVCGHETKRIGDLKWHMIIHKDPEEVKMFKCADCRYETKRKGDLKHHVVVHRTRLFKCAHCPFETKSELYLNTSHMLIHKPGAKVLKCEHCSYQTTNRVYLKLHTKIHQDPSQFKKFKCNWCDFETRHKQYLSEHMFVHMEKSDLKKYKCNFCDYEGTRKKNFKEHMLRHEVTCATYDCLKCTYRSKRKSSLRKHMEIHEDPSEVNMYKCELCTYQGKRKGNLKAHLYTHVRRLKAEKDKLEELKILMSKIGNMNKT